MDNVAVKFECKECGKSFETERQLHAHLKAHKLRVVEYYQKHYPRYDLYDNSIIKFKSKQHYFDSDFNSRTNQRKWLEEQPLEQTQDYLKDLLIKRKNKKNLLYSPCQVELRTLMSPSIVTYEKYFANYYSLCEDLGFKNKYHNIDKIIKGGFSKKHKELLEEAGMKQMPIWGNQMPVKTVDFLFCGN